jgi:hypothetical protein
MSTCSASEPGRVPRPAAGLLVAALALAFLPFGAPVATAKVTPGIEAKTSAGERITIGPAGVVIEHVDSTLDSLGKVASIHIDAGGRKRGVLVSVDDGGTGLVRMWSDIRVEPDETVNGDVVAIFGSVEVAGHVTGEVVAVFGSVHLLDGSVVDGDVVSVGGGLDQEDGATANGQTVSVGLLPVAWGFPALPVLLFVIGAVWLTSMFVGWLFATLFPGRFVRAAATASRRTGLSLLIGLLSGPAMLLSVVLLFVTVIGIPIGLILPLAYLVTKVAGYAIASYLLGCKLLRRRVGEGELVGPLASGIAFVTSFFVLAAVFVTTTGLSRAGALFFGLLGVLVAFGLTVIGIGAVLLSRFGRDPADLRYGEAVNAAAGVAPPAPPIATPLAPPGG